MIAKDIIYENKAKKFISRSFVSEEEHAAFAGIYYDQDVSYKLLLPASFKRLGKIANSNLEYFNTLFSQEDSSPTGAKPGRTLCSYDGHVVSKFIRDNDLGGLLCSSMAEKDRYAVS